MCDRHPKSRQHRKRDGKWTCLECQRIWHNRIYRHRGLPPFYNLDVPAFRRGILAREGIYFPESQEYGVAGIVTPVTD